MSEILVLAEHRRGALRDVTFELLTLAAGLAEPAGAAVGCALLGQPTEPFVPAVSKWADTLLVVDDPELANCDADSYLVALESIIRERQPALVLLGHTAAGMDLAPALAVRMGMPVSTDCLEVGRSGDRLEVLRQWYGGKLHERLTLEPAPTSLVSVRPGSVAVAEAPNKSATIERLAPPDWSARRGRKFLEYVEAELEDVDIAAASILVSVGRGIGKQENMPLVEQFAQAIGATVSCSRPVADKGWLPKSRQVGTSGKAVRPKVYLALGISGAYQHVAGMSGADTIIAVNRDPAAPIFDVAHYGIVADMFEVLPLLKERFTRH